MSASWLTIPNAISVVRLLLIPVFVWLVAIDQVGWAGVLLAVIGATDWIDGYLARKLDQVSEIGKFLDPLADRIAVAVAVIAGLIASVLPAWFGWGIILREVLIVAGLFYGWTKGVKRLDVRGMGKWATFLLYVAIAGLYIAEGFTIDWLWTVMIIIGVVGLALYYAVAVAYLGDLREAIRANETLPPQE